jgi:hypothetical protein
MLGVVLSPILASVQNASIIHHSILQKMKRREKNHEVGELFS